MGARSGQGLRTRQWESETVVVTRKGNERDRSCLGGLCLGSHQVQRRSSLEPLNLALIEAVCQLNLLGRAILMLQPQGEVLARCKGLQPDNVHLVVGLHPVIVRGVRERQSKHTLLLEVRLVDTSERAGDDGETTEEAGLEGSVLTGRALSVVVVTNDDPLDAPVTVVGSGLGHSSVLASDLVLDLVRLAVLSVDSTNQAVLCKPVSCSSRLEGEIIRTGDVLEMSTVLQPRSTSRDVVSRALALGLDEDGEVGGGLAIPRLEGLEELETVRLGVNCDLDGRAVGRRRLEGVLAGVVATGRKLVTRGILKLEGLAISTDERVGDGVEGEGAGKGEGGGDVGGGDEGVGGRVGVVTTGEVAVVRGDD